MKNHFLGLSLCLFAFTNLHAQEQKQSSTTTVNQTVKGNNVENDNRSSTLAPELKPVKKDQKRGQQPEENKALSVQKMGRAENISPSRKSEKD